MRITSKGQVTIPQAIRAQALPPGAQLPGQPLGLKEAVSFRDLLSRVRVRPETAGSAPDSTPGAQPLEWRYLSPSEFAARVPDWQAGPDDSLVRAILRHASQPPVPIIERNPSVPPELAGAVHRLLAKDPDQRFRRGRRRVEGERELAACPCRGAGDRGDGERGEQDGARHA